jgi:hypothetical protein
MPRTPASADLIDSRYAAWRLLTTLLLVTLGNSSMYVVAVVLPTVQAEFGISRADASIPYTLCMLGFGFGGMWLGRWAAAAAVPTKGCATSPRQEPAGTGCLGSKESLGAWP